jgi:hypothetical protein
MSDGPTLPTTAAQVEARGESMHQKRGRKLHPLIKQLESPIPADEVVRYSYRGGDNPQSVDGRGIA